MAVSEWRDEASPCNLREPGGSRQGHGLGPAEWLGPLQQDQDGHADSHTHQHRTEDKPDAEIAFHGLNKCQIATPEIMTVEMAMIYKGQGMRGLFEDDSETDGA
jgi:hypothetical protein